jgi:hypothetical protein
MTDKAIDILSKIKKCYVLMVETGLIDLAHHAGNAYLALTDTVELFNAVRKALEKTNVKDTLIVVTADHSHIFTIASYPARGNPILGLVKEPGKSVFAKPYTTRSYQWSRLSWRECASGFDVCRYRTSRLSPGRCNPNGSQNPCCRRCGHFCRRPQCLSIPGFTGTKLYLSGDGKGLKI